MDEVLALEAATRRIDDGPGLLHFAGVAGSGAALLASRFTRPVLYVVPDVETVRKAVDDLRYLLGGEGRVLYLLSSENSPYTETQPDRQATMQRMMVLSALAAGDAWRVLVVNATALVRRLAPRSVVRTATFEIDADSEVEPQEFAARLVEMGYLRVPVVEDPGSFAIRGGLIDVWSGGMDRPVRIDLFGDMVAEIKTFDPDTQRTDEEVPSVRICPVRETILAEEIRDRAKTRLRDLCDSHNYPSSKARQLVEDLTTGRHSFGVAGYLPAFYDLEPIWRHLPDDVAVVFEQPARCVSAIEDELAELDSHERDRAAPHYPPERLYSTPSELAFELSRRPVVCCARSFTHGKPGAPLDSLSLVDAMPLALHLDDHSEMQRAVAAARSTRGKRAVLEPLLERLSAWREDEMEVTAIARTATQARRLASLLHHRGVVVVSPHAGELDASGGEHHETDGQQPDDGGGTSLSLSVHVGTLARGIIAPLERRVLITEEEIFGQRAHVAPRRKRAVRDALEDLRALAPGDYVVHSEHGIGRYLGLENRALSGGVNLELLVVEYMGGKLFLPVYRLNQVTKYAGGESPKLDRLGGQTFAKAKSRAQRKAREMADELLALYAERNSATREPLPAADDDYAAFEAAFPYEETSDQSAAIDEVMEDLQQSRVMDRLVCGDVGFGKTEVALRAAFRCASVGRQVAVLCPTTVLAQQHYLTFSKRMADTPFEVRVLSRFQSKKAAAKTLEDLAKGTVDVVIGTHRLLSKDVQFKELGLLVVDEEQRFGVVHKERLKQLRKVVDVLTLTATPIPRTMQLAIGGLRQMSIISTPPVNRRAIRTIVARPDDAVLRDAVERELSRGGQVFYVYNRIQGLAERANRLQQLVPHARIVMAHGQMRETTLEKTMLQFVDGQYDVLVTTAIVESGLDIPRANTMLVDRADLFGLSQLYQLRGRVGRSRERAYCYLLVPAASEMSDDARSRIEALERYTDLGSGFQIATLDMELRGTGDLLGADQSGPIASVGIDMFCQMLEEATRELRGEEVTHDVDPDLHFDLDALLPDSYIEEVGVRLSVYKRLAAAVDEHDVAHVASEMEDRFGPAPEEAVRLVELMRLKVELRRLRVLVCEATSRGVSLRFREDTPLEAASLAKLVGEQRAKYRLHPDGRLTRVPKEKEAFADSLELADKMLDELRALVDA